MLNIFVNGLKSKTGGGKSYLTNILALLKASDSPHRYIVLTPDKTQYSMCSAARIEIIDIPNVYKNNFLFPILYHKVMPQLFREYSIDVIFNLGDIVIPTDKPQLYLFDWPYAVYPMSIAWKRLDLAGYLSRKAKLFWFKRYLKKATTVVAQTVTMRDRLKSIYALNNIVVVPNAVSLENLSGGVVCDYRFPRNKFKLLCLSHYYSHKNVEVFIPLAKKIKSLSLPYFIITTISPTQGGGAAEFLDEIRKGELEGVICNIGPVKMEHVPSLYSQSDALLMPTLLESFSGTYVEAMFHRKPILTSKFDFAEDVCGDGAFYFDPLDSDSILESIELAHDNVAVRQEKVERAAKRLKGMLTWEQAFGRYQELLEREMRSASDTA